MRAFVFGFVGRLTPRDDGHGGTSSESRDVEIFASHAADPTLVTALNLVACEVIVGHDHDDAGHYQTSFGDSAKRCYTLVVVPRGGKDRSDTNTTTLACEDGGPPDHSLVSALASRKRSGALVRVVFGILVASRGSPVSTTPEPDACAKWLDTLRADFESRYSSGAYVGRTKTIGRGDSYNFDNFTGVLRKHAASFDVDVEHIPGIGLARKKLEDVTAHDVEQHRGRRERARTSRGYRGANRGPSRNRFFVSGRVGSGDSRDLVAKRPHALRHRRGCHAGYVRRVPRRVRGLRVPTLIDDESECCAIRGIKDLSESSEPSGHLPAGPRTFPRAAPRPALPPGRPPARALPRGPPVHRPERLRLQLLPGERR